MTVVAIFLNPDGSHFMRWSMGGAPSVAREPRTHPSVATIAHLHPSVTHIEYIRTRVEGRVRTHDTLSQVYVFSRALRRLGAPTDDAWEEVPLTTTGQLTGVEDR